MYYGQICNQGIGCTVSGGDRTMADFFGFASDRSGGMRIVYNDVTSQHHGAHLYEIRQVGGKSIFGGNVHGEPSRTTRRPTPRGDAQWPHYSPTGAGANQPQLDFTGLQIGQPYAGTLRVRMSLASLGSLLPPLGKTNAFWLTRFQALSTGDSGEEAYRIFYVGAQSTGGLTPTLLRRDDDLHGLDPGDLQGRQLPGLHADHGPRLRQHARRGRPALGVRRAGDRPGALQRHRSLRRPQRGRRPLRRRRRDAVVRLRPRLALRGERAARTS